MPAYRKNLILPQIKVRLVPGNGEIREIFLKDL
jgi:hypothetical protein